METEIKLLDHGYVKFIESWGSDERIIEAARMSTDGAFKGWGPKHHVYCVPGMGGNYDDCSCGKKEPGDEKLLKYLWDNKHATPFEMAGLVIEVQAPIFVFREWHRHRTFSYNELSGRYTPIPDMNYIPSIERLMMGGDGKNKQAGTIKNAEVLTIGKAQLFREELEDSYKCAQYLYERALNNGVPKELARIHLPVGRYSRMRAAGNLRNWLAFITLRADKAAQWEIQEYANVVGTFLSKQFPRTWEIYVNQK